MFVHGVCSQVDVGESLPSTSSPLRDQGTPFKVTTLTLDAFAAALPLQRVDVIKIGAQGNEHRILNGARAMLAAMAVKPLLIVEIGR